MSRDVPGEPETEEVDPDPEHRHHHTDHHSDHRHHRTRTRIRIEKQHSWHRPRNVVGVPVLVLVLLVGGYLLYLNAQLSGVRRAPFLPEFAGLPSAGTNILLVGSESAATALSADPGTLVVQLVHLSADGRQAAVVHFPSDLYLPRTPSSSAGEETVLATYRQGGDPLLAQRLQANLGLSIDHVAQVSFSGYRRVTDRLGGVDLPTAQGVRHFTGAQALGYADARTGLVNGDIDTGRRNQQWIKAMLSGILRPSTLLDPVRTTGLLRDVTHNLVVDDTFTTSTMRKLAWRARHLGSSSIRYLTAPYTRFANRPGVGTVLLPDTDAIAQLGAALRADNAPAIAGFDS